MTLTAALVAFCLAAKIGDTPAEEPWLDRVLSAEPAAVLKAAASHAPPEKADVEILLHEAKYQFDEQGRTHRTTRLIFRVLGESAVSDWSVVRATWSPWHQERPVIQARVISADGKAHLLDAATLSEAPASEREADLFSDRRQLHAPLPAVAVGAVVEEQITVRESQPFFAGGVAERFDFSSYVPTRRIRLTIEAPASAPLHYQARAIQLEPKRTVRSGRVTLLFETAKVGRPATLEPYVPSSTPRVPHVAFANGWSWAEVARNYSQLTEPRLQSDKLQQLAAEIVGSEKSRVKVASRLLAHVQSLVRYTGLEFGAAAIVPHSPDDTLARRYGDCKDQAALLVGLLQAAGQPAHIALLHSGGLEDISAGLPALSVFNHAIVYLPGNPPLWIDPTAPHLRCGTLPLADQGKQALVIAPETKALTRIPATSSAENYMLDSREFRLSESSKTRVIRTMDAGGAIEHALRCDYAQLRPSEIRQRWADYIEQAYRTKNITRFACTEPKHVDQSFRIRCEAADSDLGLVTETEASVILSPSVVLDRLPYFLLMPAKAKSTDGDATTKPAAAGRKAPLVLNEPYRYELTYRVTPPVGYLAGQSPPGKTLRFGPASLSWSFKTEADETVVASIKFDTGDGRFQPADVDRLRSAISGLSDHRGTEQWHFTLHFDHRAQKLIAAKKFREGLAEYRKLLTAHGDSAELEDRYAEALVSAGFGTAAQMHARRAVQLAPRSSECWHTLGRMLTYDELGRHFQGNFDWQGAAAAYRQALQCDPHNHTARWNDAILHQYDQLGRRFGHQAKLSVALDQFRKVRTESPNLESLNDSFLYTLLFAGRFAEIKEVSVGIKPSTMAGGMRLAATAVEDGLEKCLALADKMQASADERRNHLINAASYLEESRHYDLAVKLLEQGQFEEPLAARFRVVSQILLKLRHYDDVLLPTSDPCHVVQRAYLALLLGGDPQREIAALLPPPGEQPYSGLEAVQSQLRAVLRHFEQRETAADRRGDAIALVTFESTGSDEAGYRIRASYAGGPPIDWYVLRCSQGYRLWDVGAALGGLGAAAMCHLDRGNVDAARLNLRWAAQQLNEPVFMLDPYGGTPFGRLSLSIDKSKPDQLRLPAALLMTGSRDCQSAIDFLTKVRDQQDSKFRKLQIDRALAGGLAMCNRLDEVIQVADRMLEAYPKAQEPIAQKASAWVRLGKPDEARKLGEERLKQLPGDGWARRLLGDLACERNDYPAVEKYLRHGIKADPYGYYANTIAWNAVYCTPVPAIALADAQRAIDVYASADALHTLATVCAELGKTDEARRNLKQCIEARGFVANIDWYVQGRIAEQDGCLDAAREAYRKVVEPTSRWLTTTYFLAQRRLKILGR